MADQDESASIARLRRHLVPTDAKRCELYGTIVGSFVEPLGTTVGSSRGAMNGKLLALRRADCSKVELHASWLASSTIAVGVGSVIAAARRWFTTRGPASVSDVTRILWQIEQGNPAAAEELLPLVYDELRKLAAAKLASERPGQTLQATALVHEAYVRLVGGKQNQSWDSRGHFFAAAAEAMRRILVDQARRKKSERRGGDRLRLDVTEAVPTPRARDESDRILAIHEALTVLETEMPRKAELVKLRFFAGMTLEEAAAALGIAVPTAKRDWAAARVWLYRRLSEA